MGKKYRVQQTSDWHKVRVASTANLAVASAVVNAATVDGVALVTGDRILLKNQTTAAENGIYIVAASGAASRATDWATGNDRAGHVVRVTAGTAGTNTAWLAYAEPNVVGTDAPTFIQHELT